LRRHLRKDLSPLIHRVAWRAKHEFGGDEVCTLEEIANGRRLSGDVTTQLQGLPVRIGYTVDLDSG
jgi:hypothetical protein